MDGVGVSGTSECFAPNGDTHRSGFAGTAVCVELLEAEELEGVGEDGREGVGVTADKGSVCARVLVGVMVGGCEEEVGGAGTDVLMLMVALGFWTSDARCCSCRDVRDAVRRCMHGPVSS